MSSMIEFSNVTTNEEIWKTFTIALSEWQITLGEKLSSNSIKTYKDDIRSLSKFWSFLVSST